MTRRRDGGDGYLGERKVGGKLVGWVGTFEVAPVHGKRRRKAVYGVTRQETKAKLAEAMRKFAVGQLTVGKGTTGEWLNRWIKEVVAPSEAQDPPGLQGYRDQPPDPRHRRRGAGEADSAPGPLNADRSTRGRPLG